MQDVENPMNQNLLNPDGAESSNYLFGLAFNLKTLA